VIVEEEEEEGLWRDQMTSIGMFLERQAVEEREMRQEATENHLEILREQVEEQKRQREEERSSRFGEVENDFFKGFGTSCR